MTAITPFGVATTIYSLAVLNLMSGWLLEIGKHFNCPDGLWFLKGMDQHHAKLFKSSDSFSSALFKNTFLFSLFFVQHVVMAGPFFKKQLFPMIFGSQWEFFQRPIYTLTSALCLQFLIMNWAPMPQVILPFALPFWLATIIHLSGVALTMYSMCTIGFTDFMFGDTKGRNDIIIAGPYRYMRDPMVLGWFISVWAVPTHLTFGRLFFNIVTSAFAYCATVYHEEPLLKKTVGEPYLEYMKKVPTRFTPSNLVGAVQLAHVY
jgi:protein-S-isoprenylcysteine O-methyltransferase Ste14